LPLSCFVFDFYTDKKKKKRKKNQKKTLLHSTSFTISLLWSFTQSLVNRLLVTTGKAKSASLSVSTDGSQDIWHRKDLDKGLMFVFMEFLSEQKERLVNLFNSMDKDKSGTITRQEFKNGMQVSILFLPFFLNFFSLASKKERKKKTTHTHAHFLPSTGSWYSGHGQATQ
jgi:hypothetical protein